MPEHPARSLQHAVDAVTYLSEAAATLGWAYEPTKKNPGLAVARCPSHLKVVLTSLGTALRAVCADLATNDAEVAQEYAATHALLARLEDRVCRTVPAQGAGPSGRRRAGGERVNGLSRLLCRSQTQALLRGTKLVGSNQFAVNVLSHVHS
ncbi:hypothetical protein ACIRSF_33560 [Streptomyces rubiginosohelvolus]|uniref:hypothetical protein n=1 Tax=Streptomyces rubiginosohelvolus TaxID=67362 RepID=UPI0037F97FB9